jgi:DNA helicase-2/ATP-dependent DNA helicase PcrA
VRQACAGLFELLYHFTREGEAQPAALITQIIDQTGWFQSLQNDLDGRQAIQRLRTLQEEAALYRSLPDFLHAMAGKVSFQLDEEGVALSTIHGAKGLEWPVVFLSGFNQGILPAEGALRSAFGGDPVEERHVAHVALSRARDLLVLSWFRERVLENGRSLPYRRSDLISHIPKEKIYAYRSPNDLQVRSPDGLPESHYAAVEEELETSFLG